MKKTTARITKCLLALLLSMTLFFCSFPVVVADSEQISSDGKYRYFLENDEVTFKGLAKWGGEKIEIPSRIDGYPVTKIGSHSFYMDEWVQEVVIPNTVTVIEDVAFEQCYVQKVVIPDSVKIIEACAFLNCFHLTQLILGNGLTEIHRMAFSGCGNLSTVDLPESLITIEERAFTYCAISELTLPKNLLTIGDLVFSGCSNLTEITIPASLINLGDFVFSGCTNLSSITVDPDNPNFCSEDGVLFNKDKTMLMQYPAGKTGEEYTVTDTVVTIEGGAFSGNPHLIRVTIPNSVTYMGQSVFSNCASLTTVTLGENVVSIEGMAFLGCINLSAITIPNSVTSIGVRAFYNCEKLSNVVLKNGITTIGEEAFAYCPNLIQVVIPASVSQIGMWAFGYNGNDATKVTLYGMVGSAAQKHANETWRLSFVDIEKVTLGNPNGDEGVNAKDALLVLKIAVGKLTSFANQETAADVNNDGKIDAKDALEILKKAVGKPSCF